MRPMPAQATILMALLQPAPEVYNLFDDIMLLAEGHIVYYGPKEEVRDVFASNLSVQDCDVMSAPLHEHCRRRQSAISTHPLRFTCAKWA